MEKLERWFLGESKNLTIRDQRIFEYLDKFIW